MAKFKVAMLYGVGDIRVEERDIPSIDCGEVLVRVRAATTCGTDVKIFQRGYVGGVISFPSPFGHEWAGDIVEVGGKVEKFSKGMRVRGGNSAPCLQCEMCREGRYNLCEDRVWLWGAYAEYIKVPEQIVKLNLHEIPSNLSYEEAALTEPLACVLHGALKTNMKPGETVAIIGSGPIGILHLQLAKHMGASKTIVIDAVDERLKVASSLGADVAVNINYEDPVECVRKETRGYGVHVVIECVGKVETWMQALRLARKGGRVLMFGGCPPNTEIRVSTELLHYGELSIIGSFHATPQEFHQALNLIASNVVNVKPLITGSYPLEKIGEAFQILTTSKKALKLVIKP
jgi:L-iditol 2-dehydrogenase